MTPTWPLRVACTARRTAGLHDLDDRDAVPLAGVPQDGSAGAVAGDDEHLDALLDQVVHHVEGEGPHLGDGARPVGSACGVADVQDRLVGQQVEHRAGHRQPADTAVEDADRCVRHRASVTATVADPRGSAGGGATAEAERGVDGRQAQSWPSIAASAASRSTAS